MKVLVCGGRDCQEVDLIHKTLNAIHAEGPITLLIHGAAKGADWWAGQWAVSNGIDVCTFPANWAHHGKPAGPRRNTVMLLYSEPNLVVAFPGGSGTADMVKKAKAGGFTVMEVGVGA